jgi:hypothetical protein
MEDCSAAGRRRSWNEIVTYYHRSVEETAYYTQLNPEYRCPGYALMVESAKLARDDERFGSLVTVGSVGSVIIFPSLECRWADRHIEVRPLPNETAAEISIFCRESARDVPGAATFREAGPALEHFASLLREHGFLDRAA